MSYISDVILEKQPLKNITSIGQTCAITTSTIAATDNINFDSGICLTEAKAEQSNLPSGENILYAWGFDETYEGADYMLPIGYMSSADGKAYSNDESGLKGTLGYERPG